MFFRVKHEIFAQTKYFVSIGFHVDTICMISYCWLLSHEQLQKLVVENVLAFNEGFWIRLAARTDTCKSDDDKAWFST